MTGLASCLQPQGLSPTDFMASSGSCLGLSRATVLATLPVFHRPRSGLVSPRWEAKSAPGAMRLLASRTNLLSRGGVVSSISASFVWGGSRLGESSPALVPATPPRVHTSVFPEGSSASERQRARSHRPPEAPPPCSASIFILRTADGMLRCVRREGGR